jgi:hypothetical protein
LNFLAYVYLGFVLGFRVCIILFRGVFSERETHFKTHDDALLRARSREEEGAETERARERERIDTRTYYRFEEVRVRVLREIDRKRTIYI